MINKLPKTAQDFMGLSWCHIEPYVRELLDYPINQENIYTWLGNWSDLTRLEVEAYQRHYVATTQNTSDELAARAYHKYLDQIYPSAQVANNRLKNKLIASGLEPAGFEIQLRNMKAETTLFCSDNLPLLSEELKLCSEYDRIIGAQTVKWEGNDVTLTQLTPISHSSDRNKREHAWWLAADRRLEDRQAINEVWMKLMMVRKQIATNAGTPDYGVYRWLQLLRFDYTPENCFTFHQAIKQEVTPALQRLYEKRRQRLGLTSLRPWDLFVHPAGGGPLQPFQSIPDLVLKVSKLFHNVDPGLGEYFDTMNHEELMDLDNRKCKAPGGYCSEFDVVRKPFIFMNAVGLHEDLMTLVHEGGHAFHVFEMAPLPYHSQTQVPMEFCEVASMAMEMLVQPYFSETNGGVYTPQDANRAIVEHRMDMLSFWPYMAVVDAFQHWVYKNHALASHPANCDTKWGELWGQYMVGVDYSGMDDWLATGWQRKPHIIQNPFYYIEYGLAALGAYLVWQNTLMNQAEAISAYRKALASGGTLALPQLYTIAGARLAFDAITLGEAVRLIEGTINALDP